MPFLTPSYQPELVALSFLIACLAGYATLSLAAGAGAARRASWAWLGGSALILGFGIWAMHFIGMLALRVPVPMAYALPTTLLSWLAAVLAATLALHTIHRPRVGPRELARGGVLLGLSITSMHYLGMHALRFGGHVEYDPGGVALSVLVAVGAATAALWLGLRVRVTAPAQQERWRLGGALVLGLAIASMHYTGMHAAHFHLDGMGAAGDMPGVLSSLGLARGVALVAVTLLGMAVWALLMNERVTSHVARSAELQRLNGELERRVAERTEALEHAHAELLAYAVAVSHELAEPTRRAAGVTHLLERALGDAADPRVQRYLALLRQEVDSMGTHVAQLKQLPFFQGAPARFEGVSLGVLVRQVRSDLEPLLRGRRVQWVMDELPRVRGDTMLLRLAFTEVLAATLDAAGNVPQPRIEVWAERQEGEVVVSVRHGAPGGEAPPRAVPLALRAGERIGLASARRILHQHGGSLETEPGLVRLRLPADPEVKVWRAEGEAVVCQPA
ncbi:diguanylate cyclase/phosphodiesterase [Deinococcus aerius]|uniref:Diguanylate cyclase/phosphodiesterase n=1 Tax=Deinococcus aerius TaxID=200253 RepID=A0A2I9DK30_9DEIO|nr:MHYT domain-containing protein [Deinococcus aerius]GBF06728.1 diguanylate cyclase/phosphodiesterase [Deinococcus aerius]